MHPAGRGPREPARPGLARAFLRPGLRVLPLQQATPCSCAHAGRAASYTRGGRWWPCRAVDAGYNDLDQIRRDPLLDPVPSTR